MSQNNATYSQYRNISSVEIPIDGYGLNRETPQEGDFDFVYTSAFTEPTTTVNRTVEIPIDGDGLNKENPQDNVPIDEVDFNYTNTSTESTTIAFSYFVPEFVKNNPEFYHENMPKYFNREHFHFVHCPYTAEYIVNSEPPTFHRKCARKSSKIGWPGRCIQTFENIPGLITGDNSTIFVLKNCRFVYL